MSEIGLAKIDRATLNKKEKSIRDKLKKDLIIPHKIKLLLMVNKKLGTTLINLHHQTKEIILAG